MALDRSVSSPTASAARRRRGIGRTGVAPDLRKVERHHQERPRGHEAQVRDAGLRELVELRFEAAE